MRNQQCKQSTQQNRHPNVMNPNFGLHEMYRPKRSILEVLLVVKFIIFFCTSLTLINSMPVKITTRTTPSLLINKTKSPTELMAATLRALLVMILKARLAPSQKETPKIPRTNIESNENNQMTEWQVFGASWKAEKFLEHTNFDVSIST